VGKFSLVDMGSWVWHHRQAIMLYFEILCAIGYVSAMMATTRR